MKNYIISNGLIEREIKLSRSILEVIYRLKERYSLQQIF